MTKKSRNSLLWALGLLLALSLVAAAVAVPYFSFIEDKDPWTGRGQAGDMFGGANALLSTLALLAVLYTVHLQRKELKLQRKELKRSRKAQEASKEALEDQNEALRLSARVASLGSLIAIRKFQPNSADTAQMKEIDEVLKEILKNELGTSLSF